MHPTNWFQTPLTRRRMLRSTTAGGLATFMGMPIRGLLGRETEGRPRRPAQADAVILLWMGGGMSHLDTFDPKPGTATGGEFAAIRTAVDGINVSEILPTVASQLQHATILRSLTGDSADHGSATHAAPKRQVFCAITNGSDVPGRCAKPGNHQHFAPVREQRAGQFSTIEFS